MQLGREIPLSINYAGRAPAHNLMKIKNPQIKTNLVQRLKRIEGQVRGVQTMMSEERDCREVLQQLTAIRSAVQSVSLVFLEEYASECLLDPATGEPGQREEALRELFRMIEKV